MITFGRSVIVVDRRPIGVAWLICASSVGLWAGSSSAQTGTFIDRHQSTDLRVVTYNVLWDSIFPAISVVQAEKFARVVQALDPDVLHLQEIDSPFDDTTSFDAADVANLMDLIMPLPAGGGWYTYKGGTNVMASKYPLSMTRSTVSPHPPATSYAVALVDLSDEKFPADFYFMNSHFKCCGEPGGAEDVQRQRQADALVNWMRDARTPGGFVNLPTGTPMAVVGDLNIVGNVDPLENLIAGTIVDSFTYGSNSPPDWDETPLTDAHPLHNGRGPDDYTWRNDPSGFPRGRLDYVLYTDSVVDVANHFVLNTVTMTAPERAATGLLQGDIRITNSNYDHLPVVVDFRFPVTPMPGDYNADGKVDAEDFEVWKAAFGSTVDLAADGNGNGVVDAADFTFWRDHWGEGTGEGSAREYAVPEPAANLLVVLIGGVFGWSAGGRSRRLGRWHRELRT